MNDIVEDLAQFQRGWSGGLPETACGYGSKVSTTLTQRLALAEWARKYEIRTIADIGAGDLNWVGRVAWPDDATYQAYDLVPRHSDVIQFDIVREIPPASDLLLCVWVLNHLPENDGRAALANLVASQSQYLAITWRPSMLEYLDMRSIESVEIWPEKFVELRLIRL